MTEKMSKECWRKQFKNCPEKIRLQATASDGSGDLLWKINKKGERIPRLLHTFCNLRYAGRMRRCTYTKCSLIAKHDFGGAFATENPQKSTDKSLKGET